MRPTFIGIGAQKCASTWLYDILADHPDVALSTIKEIDFFSHYYDRGFQWYERHFPVQPGARAVGEISPSYFHEPPVPARVKSCAPDAKIIVFLRDPVERAISNHKHEIRIGHFQGQDLSLDAGLANNPMYIEQGRYMTHLARWFDYFPREQVLIVLFDDITADPQGAARRVYEFLGIDGDHRSRALTIKSNESYANRHPWIENFRKRFRTVARRLGLDWLWKAAATLGLQRLYRTINRLPPERVVPPISEATRHRLRACFADEITKLEILVQRPLDHWR